VNCIYEVPLMLPRRGAGRPHIAERLNIWSRAPELGAWQRVVARFKNAPRGTVRIGIVGKYVHLKDSYKSLHEALVHGGLDNECKGGARVHRLREQVEGQGPEALLSHLDAVLVPGGVRRSRHRGEDRGDRLRRGRRACPSSGSASACSSRSCEFARAVAGLEPRELERVRQGHAARRDRPPCPTSAGVRNKGATMRLGSYPCVLVAGTVRSRRVRADGDRRAASPPLRVRQRLSRDPLRGRARAERHVAGQAPRRDGRAPRAPVSSWVASSIRSSRAARHRRTPLFRAVRARGAREAGPPACGAKGASCRRARPSSTRHGDGLRPFAPGVLRSCTSRAPH